MSYKDFYQVILRAVSALYQGSPVGSHEILSWIQENEPAVVEGLRARGYLDADDPNRTRWSWRQYLGNAMVRLKSEGGLLLEGHTKETPAGYYGPVGLWAPVDQPQERHELKLASFRLPASQVEDIKTLASTLGLPNQKLLQMATAYVPRPRNTPLESSAWLEWLEENIPTALSDSELPPRIRAQRDLMWFSTALTLLVAEELDPGDAPWSLCGLPSTHKRSWVPDRLKPRVAKKWHYEEGSDFAIFTKRDGRYWPLVAMESEAANWYSVGNEAGNDYMWDFYKLFGRKASCSVMVGRVAGHRGDTDIRGRMERLAETMDQAVYQPYRHLLFPGQVLLAVLVPAARIDDYLLGAAVNPSTFEWRWMRQ